MSGVPEQGLREALEALLVEWQGDAEGRRGSAEMCLGNAAAMRERNHLLNIARTYEHCACQLRAALERPRPALPAPEPRPQSCGHSMLTDGIEVGCVEYAIELGRRMGHVDAGYVLSHEEVMRRVGAALPPQTGNPPPSLLDVDALTLQDLHEIAAAGQQAGGAMTQWPSVLRKLLKRIAVDQGGVSSPRAPQSGPWRIRELSDETGWWVEQIKRDARYRTTITVPVYAWAETICAALNGALLGSGAETPPQPETLAESAEHLPLKGFRGTIG